MILKTELLVKKYGRLKALDGLSADIEEGKCIALIGPNASGKTTLIKSILGLVVPDSGTIYFRDVPVNGRFEYRSEIGYMAQTGRYPDNMPIGHLFRMIAGIRQRNFSDCDTELMNAFELEAMFSKRLGALSGGTRQKISAALAFLFDPAIVILDEPTAGLDTVSCEMLKNKLHREKAKGKTIMISSHVLGEIDDLVDEVMLMMEGKIIFRKSPSLLRSETGEMRLSGAVARTMGYIHNE